MNKTHCRWESMFGRNPGYGRRLLPMMLALAVLQVGSVEAQVPPLDCAVDGFDDKCEAWISVPYDGPGHDVDFPGDADISRRDELVVSPDGESLYVVGTSDMTPPNPTGVPSDYDSVVVAYEAETGGAVWTTRYPGTDDMHRAFGLAGTLGAEGETLYSLVKVDGFPDSERCTWLVIAYEAATGQERWRWTYPNEVDCFVSPRTIKAAAVLDHGDSRPLVFVSGTEISPEGALRTFVVALDGSSGESRWVRRYSGELGASAGAMTVAPDGSSVYVSGGLISGPGEIHEDYTLLAYRATDGSLLWEAHDPMPEGEDIQNGGIAVAASPDGSLLFVTGVGLTPALEPPNGEIRTFAHDAGTGKRLWGHSFQASAGTVVWTNEQHSIGVSPDASHVFVAALMVAQHVPGAPTVGPENQFGWILIALDAASGDQVWRTISTDPVGKLITFAGLDEPLMAVDPLGEEVYLTQARHGNRVTVYGTAAYNAETGAQRWIARWTLGNNSVPHGLVPSPDGSRLFVTGMAGRVGDPPQGVQAPVIENSYDIVTVAYDRSGPGDGR